MKVPPAAKQSTPRLRLRLTPAAETAVRSGHPWIFSESIRDQNRAGDPGELAVVYDRRDRFLAVGLYDPRSPLRVRVLCAGKPVTLSPAWWRQNFLKAVSLRKDRFDSGTNGYRWINGESDGWPGLVLDRYADTAVLKLYSAIWLPRLDELKQLVHAELQPKQIVLRLSKNIQAEAHDRFDHIDGQILSGTSLKGPVAFQESGLHFQADVIRGQKTGFFLDQRENRRIVESLAHGRHVLNAFSFTGGFSLYAARGGASSVTDLDISAHALAASVKNFSLNASVRTISACRCEQIQADAFDWLEGNRSRKFDLIVLDPPSLAKRESERAGALRAYGRLARSGINALRPRGILVAASCSAHVTSDEFFSAVKRSARNSGRPFKELRTTFQSLDHPATFPEAHYLKCIFLEFA